MYKIEYLESVIENDIKKLPKSHKNAIKKAIEQKIAINPIEFGKPLRYSLKGCRRLRVGDHRVIYRIEKSDLVLIIKIGHRKEVYENQ
jgi:mRNA interferase RelE/StbE